jgi:hypothetical protein
LASRSGGCLCGSSARGWAGVVNFSTVRGSMTRGWPRAHESGHRTLAAKSPVGPLGFRLAACLCARLNECHSRGLALCPSASPARRARRHTRSTTATLEKSPNVACVASDCRCPARRARKQYSATFKPRDPRAVTCPRAPWCQRHAGPRRTGARGRPSDTTPTGAPSGPGLWRPRGRPDV